MTDRIRQSIHSGYMVIWEEVARDGAQAKTLLTGDQRVQIACAQSGIFGENAPQHLIFAAGYPAMCKEEYEIIAQLVDQVHTCSLATHGRARKGDIDLGIQVMKPAPFGRVSFALPISEKHSQVMLHQSREETLRQSVDLARYAVDKAQGLPIDVAFGVSSRVEPEFLAEAATALSDEGIATIKICDSTGVLFPLEIRRLYKSVLDLVPEHVCIGAHLHNDFGLALANNLEAVQLGVRMVSTSWIGLGERNGLAATEQILFALSYNPEQIPVRLGVSEPLWAEPPDLKGLTPIAQQVSQMVHVPLKLTDPVVSTHMNHIGTGAYFNNPAAFKPFDPQEELGVPPQLYLSHLANHSIVDAMAQDLGYNLDEDQIRDALIWVKAYAFQQGRSAISDDEFSEYLAGLSTA